jgi:hypothetical protein
MLKQLTRSILIPPPDPLQAGWHIKTGLRHTLYCVIPRLISRFLFFYWLRLRWAVKVTISYCFCAFFGRRTSDFLTRGLAGLRVSANALVDRGFRLVGVMVWHSERPWRVGLAYELSGREKSSVMKRMADNGLIASGLRVWSRRRRKLAGVVL